MINKHRVLKIAHVMSEEGLNPNFIKNMVNLSFEFDACYELMELWLYDTDEVNRINLIADMMDKIEDIKDE